MKAHRYQTLIMLAAASALGIVLASCGGSTPTDDTTRLAPGNQNVGQEEASPYDDHDRCGTPTPTVAEIERVNQEISASQVLSRATGTVYINVYVHVINNGSSTSQGNIPDSWITNQINVLNNAYSGVTGGTATQFRFTHVSTSRTTNSSWYTCTPGSSAETSMKNTLRQGTADDLNFYINNMGDLRPISETHILFVRRQWNDASHV